MSAAHGSKPTQLAPKAQGVVNERQDDLIIGFRQAEGKGNHSGLC
jgi:hypothetical protein